MRVLCALLLLALTATAASAQRGGRGGRGGMAIEPNVPYSGQYTFVRLRYGAGEGLGGWGGRSGWAFDYPQMERNFMTVLADLTTMNPRVGESNVLDMDDPELARYSIAYLSEPGYWAPTRGEAEGLRSWIRKGGFLIVDDFFGRQWLQFEQSMREVLPEARIQRLDISHPIFHAFFDLQTLEGMHHPQNRAYAAEFLGIFEDNDPSKRLLVIINYNNDIGDYMEWSGQGWYPVNFTNDAYKFATNYLVYAMTH